jgi:hypothetical protein
MRPLLDIHHIELFIVWRTLWMSNRDQTLFQWLLDLQNRLFARRSGKANLPFLDGRNSLDSVFESVATRERPHEFCDRSSLFLTCLLELCFSLPPDGRDLLLRLIHQRLVLGNADCGERMEGCQPIDLMLCVPPIDWGERILSNSLSDESECIIVGLEGAPHADVQPLSLADRISRFAQVSRTERPFQLPEGLPMSIVVLACLKHGTPLPPEFWRMSVFGPVDSDA